MVPPKTGLLVKPAGLGAPRATNISANQSSPLVEDIATIITRGFLLSVRGVSRFHNILTAFDWHLLYYGVQDSLGSHDDGTDKKNDG